MPETVHVVVGFDGDSEQFYAHKASAGEAEGASDRHEGDVPAPLWERHERIWRDYALVMDELRAAVGVDDEGRARVPCPRWTGYVRRERRWWTLQIAATDDPEGYPQIPLNIGHHWDTEAEARAELEALTDEFAVVNPWLWPISKASVSVIEQGWPAGRSDACDNCGHERDAHADRGEPS